MVAIVTKIDIQILRLLHWLFFNRAAVWQDEMMVGGEGRREFFFSCTPYVVSFGGLLVSVHAWQLLAGSLCSRCLCARLRQHPPALLPPDLAPLDVLLPRRHERENEVGNRNFPNYRSDTLFTAPGDVVFVNRLLVFLEF